MTTLTLALADVSSEGRLREVDAEWAAVLAESIAEQGQMTPIEVRETPDGPCPYALVAGAHRLRALEKLGWPTVVATVFDGGKLAAELREIDENLVRHELSALDRAAFLAKRQEIYEEIHPEAKRGGDRRSDQSEKKFVLVASFTKATADRLGFGERTIQLAIRRHTALHPDVRRRLTGTRLANHAQQLDLLAACRHDEQLGAVELLFGETDAASKRPQTVGEALDRLRNVAVLPITPDDKAFATFASLWRKRSPAFRQRVRDFVKINKEGSK